MKRNERQEERVKKEEEKKEETFWVIYRESGRRGGIKLSLRK